MPLEKMPEPKNVARPVNAIDLYNVIGLILQVYLFEKFMSTTLFFYNNLTGIKSFKIPMIGILLAMAMFFIFINISAFYLTFKEDDDKKRFKYVSGILANSVIIIVISGVVSYLMSTVI